MVNPNNVDFAHTHSVFQLVWEMLTYDAPHLLPRIYGLLQTVENSRKMVLLLRTSTPTVDISLAEVAT